MKKIFQLTSLLVLAALVFSCAKPTELSTDQYDGAKILLQAYGPQPVVRGGVLRFVGSNLDKVATVTIPGVAPLTPEVVTSGVHSEIRVTVPKDGPEPGYPVLTLTDGNTITAKTILTYSEPISISEVTPSVARPGASITIKGDYLNLIHEVVFADKVKVSETQFTSHDRYSISLKVPAAAQTGKLGLGTVDELAVAGTDQEAALLSTLNMVETDNEFMVITASGSLFNTQPKAGSILTITGSNMDLTQSVSLKGAVVTDFTVSDNSIKFTLPETVTDGPVVLVMASGVEVPVGEIVTVVPTKLKAAPVPVKNGADITISGMDLDLVAGLDFPHSKGAEFTYANDVIVANVTEAAQAGDIVLSLANGKSVTVAYSLVEPVITGFSANPAAAGSDIVIEGKDLDLVAAVTFGGDYNVEPKEASATALTVAVPTAAESGALVLNLKNGSSVEAAELTVDKPAGAYIGIMPETVFNPGDMFIVEIENPDHLTAVQVDGEDVVYILNGKTLYFAIPVSAKADSELTLVSDNGSVTYTLNIDPGTEVSYVIWSGNEDMGSWSNQPYVGEFGFFLNHPEVAPGDVITFYIVPNADWWQMQIYDGNWGGQVCTAPNAENCPDGIMKLEITQELLDKLNGLENWGGLFVVQGEGCSLIQLTVTHYIPQETVIWEGSEDMGSWSNQPYVGEFGALMTYNITPGAKVRFYVAGTSDAWFQMQIFDGNWGGQVCDPATTDNTIDGYYEFTLTQEIIDKLNGLDNWGGLFVVQGNDCILTKISLIHLVK